MAWTAAFVLGEVGVVMTVVLARDQHPATEEREIAELAP